MLNGFSAVPDYPSPENGEGKGDQMNLPQKVTVVEVGPRDGLQNEAAFVPTDQKIELIERLSETGLKRIEITSFVHPKAIPQLQDSEELVKRVKKNGNFLFNTGAKRERA